MMILERKFMMLFKILSLFSVLFSPWIVADDFLFHHFYHSEITDSSVYLSGNLPDVSWLDLQEVPGFQSQRKRLNRNERLLVIKYPDPDPPEAAIQLKGLILRLESIWPDWMTCRLPEFGEINFPPDLAEPYEFHIIPGSINPRCSQIQFNSGIIVPFIPTADNRLDFCPDDLWLIEVPPLTKVSEKDYSNNIGMPGISGLTDLKDLSSGFYSGNAGMKFDFKPGRPGLPSNLINIDIMFASVPAKNCEKDEPALEPGGQEGISITVTDARGHQWQQLYTTDEARVLLASVTNAEELLSQLQGSNLIIRVGKVEDLSSLCRESVRRVVRQVIAGAGHFREDFTRAYRHSGNVQSLVPGIISFPVGKTENNNGSGQPSGSNKDSSQVSRTGSSGPVSTGSGGISGSGDEQDDDEKKGEKTKLQCEASELTAFQETGLPASADSEKPFKSGMKKPVDRLSSEHEEPPLKRVAQDVKVDVVVSDGGGVDKFMALTPEDRLKVMFDYDSLEDFGTYTIMEEGKDTGVIAGWQFLLKKVREGIFHSSPDSIMTFLKELHRTFYPGTYDPNRLFEGYDRSHWMGVSGKFRSELKSGDFGTFFFKKSSRSLLSTQGILHYARTLKEFYKLKGLPDLPAIMLDKWSWKPTDPFYAPRLIAISLDCCESLLSDPPDSGEVFRDRVLKSYEDFSLNGELIRRVDRDWGYHKEALENLDYLHTFHCVEKAGCSSVHSVPPFHDFGNTVCYLRGLPPPAMITEELVTCWCQKLYGAVQREFDKTSVFREMTSLVYELAAIRPFKDGNCRTYIFLLQGLLMSYGFQPVHLNTRYIFGLTPDEGAGLLERAINSGLPDISELPEELIDEAAAISLPLEPDAVQIRIPTSP